MSIPDRLSYQRRMDDGHEYIERARVNGAEVAAWETFWLDLLREYEQVCEQLMPSSEVKE